VSEYTYHLESLVEDLPPLLKCCNIDVHYQISGHAVPIQVALLLATLECWISTA